jgi:hypothetical protein
MEDKDQVEEYRKDDMKGRKRIKVEPITGRR